MTDKQYSRNDEFGIYSKYKGCGKEVARESGYFSLDQIMERIDRYADMMK